MNPLTGLEAYETEFGAVINLVDHGLDFDEHKKKELLLRFAETKDATQLCDIFRFSPSFLISYRDSTILTGSKYTDTWY